MRTQRVSHNTKKSSKDAAQMLRRPGLKETPIKDNQTGFIHHPAGFPIDFKRIWFEQKDDTEESLERSDIGLIFESEKYFKPGIMMEITIPLPNEIATFRGKVVLVRHNGESYEIGIWLRHRADASRARIVEQVCHIETYLKQKKFRDGPYSLNREKLAEEWITKYASTVPTL